MKYFECKTCGNVMVLLEDSGVIPMCCGATMAEIVPQSNDGPKEKHVPIIERKDNEITVKVGEILHPMEDTHYIKWIVLTTDKGKYIKYLVPSNEPIVKFYIGNDETPLIVYSYCNIHSLWMNKA